MLGCFYLGGIFNGKTFIKDKVFYNKEISDNKKGGLLLGNPPIRLVVFLLPCDSITL